MKIETNYFSGRSHENSVQALELAKKNARELGIKHVLVASSTGRTGVMAADIFKETNIKLVVVSQFAGGIKFDSENRKRLEEKGIIIVKSVQPMYGIDRSLMKVFGGISENYIIAQTLRLLSQGLKVAVEITLMACDSGVIPTDENVIAIGGTKRGADTVAIIKPSYSSMIFDKEYGLRVRGIIAKPW